MNTRKFKKKDSRDRSAFPLSSNADVNDCLKLTAVGHQRIEWAKQEECHHLAPHAWFHRKPTVKTVVTYTSLHVIWYISANQLWAQSLPGSSGIPYARLLQYLLKETNWDLSPTVLSPPPCNPPHPLVQWSYFVVLSPLSPLLTSPQSAPRKSIAIDFGRQQKAVGIQGEELGRDRDREVLAERCEPLSVYACAGTAKGHRHEPLCNNRLWSVSASEVSRMR